MNKWQEQAKKQLKQARVRVTQPRLIILSTLLCCEHPMTHQQIEALLLQSSVISIDRVTLYRVLECLIKHDLAHKVSGGDRVWRFEACSQHKSHNFNHIHPHFHCGDCDQFVCLAADMEPQIALALPAGFQGKSVDVTIKGRCSDCNTRGDKHET